MVPDHHICRCDTQASLHGPEHVTCCKCIRCGRCGDWIRQSYWREHVALPNEQHVVSRPTSLADGEKSEPPLPDSLVRALEEISMDDVLKLDADFQQAVRHCVGKLIDHLYQGTGPYPLKERSEAWHTVLMILIDRGTEPDEKVASLLNLFGEDDFSEELEAQLFIVVANSDQLFPVPSSS